MSKEVSKEVIHRTRLDPGDGRVVTQQIIIKVWSDGALSVEGPVDDPAWCLAALENAKDAIRNRRSKKQERLIVPGRDVSVEAALHPLNEKPI
jgi:hypothetical protein